MCGIIGEFNRDATFKRNKRQGFITQSLICDTVRGYDSTGVFAVPKDPTEEIFLFKKAIAGPDFVQLDRFMSLLADIEDYKFIVGHNRWATRGGISSKTAHPFQKQNITMVHNGTLKTWYNLHTKGNYSVDSEAIAASLAENGVEDTIKELNGAYALVWHDSVTDKMYMIRNEERTLYYATIKGSDSIIFASEHGMLSWIGDRNGYDIDKIHDIEPDYLYEFDGDFQKKVNRTKMETYASSFEVRKKPARDLKEIEKFMDDGLVGLGLKSGEYFEATPIKFTPYAGVEKDKGVFTCTPIHNIPANFVIHGQPHDAFQLSHVVSGEVIAYGAPRADETLPTVYLRNAYTTGLTEEEFINWAADAKSLDAEDVIEEEDIEEYVEGPDKKLITVAEFERLTKHGCSICSGDIFLEEDESMSWTANDEPICSDCTRAEAWSNHINVKH